MLEIKKIDNATNSELELLYIAFKSKWDKLVKECTFENFSRLYCCTISDDSCYRVLLNGELAGVFGISDKKPSKEHAQYKRTKKQFSDWRWHIGIGLLNESISKGECYISFLVIGNKFQGRGIGRACLEFIEEESVKKEEVDYISLFVATDNERAANMYKNNGFKIIKTVNSFLTKYFIGKKSWYKMIKVIK